ncbi:CMP-N-acetylneuraminate-beta-galactosamide-alpha-2,3-sialyltransferase 1 [Pimephales promelas]|uniref:CMP-N-acetylneuraminate-beta-galactosamide- alpha-2,3-sialyltransferase 1 n=1 Tax=Pimephales promelas TaxID=90988 RepID=UPI001955A816|nr:CMP-N-acetylneuraminate-beta-galactosamide-alpha-2,3-sialyltransferase 1 [Pimephales promelas]XP_039537415.1 CMP-N-acetylneuraminate-beta-galactosamide-alpha-2,3-sialyltransferase 1 [Pimephales promelas]KAG1946790.1 CMP-N-acetylneuraminate-beta-galactosamide-alpha-2,3-sialyltransferase [Pimephales promelas]
MTMRLKRVFKITALLSSTTILLFLYFQNAAVVLINNSYSFVFERAQRTSHICLEDSGNSSWFNERYKPTVPLLLNSTNSVLQRNIFSWWKELQDVRSASNYTKVVDQLFSLFPNEDHYSDAGPDRCRTCAVVGNSGNILGSNYGQLIDSHDLVIRINKGPTEDYEKDVGNKTTHRIMYPESAVDLDDNTYLVLLPVKVLDMQWLISAFTTRHIRHTYTNVPSSIKANKDKVMILHPEFIKYVHDNWAEGHGRYPSTGFLTLIFALHICDKVDVFGFGANSDRKWHHYFDKTMTSFENDSHGGDFENKTINQLHQENKILMYKGLK